MNKERRARITKVITILEEQMVEVDEVTEEEQEAFDAMPEGLQESVRGWTSQDAITSLESASNELATVLDTLNSAIE